MQVPETVNICWSLQQRECIVLVSPSPSQSPSPFSSQFQSPFWIFFLGSSAATDHKRKVLKSLLFVPQIKVKVKWCSYVLYGICLSHSLSPSLSFFLIRILPLSLSLGLVMHIINDPHKLSCSLPEKNSPVSRKFVQITITKLVYTNLPVLYCNNTKLPDMFFKYLKKLVA